MKIIILGMDNTGKTTLASELKEHLGYKLVNSFGPNFVKEEVEETLKNYLLSDEDIIFERFSPIEEIIYGNTLRGESKFTLEDNIFKIVNDVKPIIIYCRPSIKVIQDWKAREQMEGVIEQSNRLIKAWDNFINSFNIDYIKWNYKEDSLESLLTSILRK